MPRKSLRISLVIPVYNEESHIADCLSAALQQRLPFHEIIVVDNNSSDDTAAIVRAFPGVRLLSENRQGVVFARNRGFDAAEGDIIARIDADTRLPSDWTQQLTTAFEEGADAVSGALTYYDVSAHTIVDAIDAWIRDYLARKMFAHRFLLGANMAIRKSVWRQVRSQTCTSALHEDLDLAVHLAEVQARVEYAPIVLAGVSGRRADTNLVDFLQYVRTLPKTYAIHGLREQRHMYPIMAFVIVNYLPLRIAYRGYDIHTKSFKLTQLFGVHATPRVNPATFVD